MVITNAPGNRIRTTETRADITFEFQKADGRVVRFPDSAGFGDVTQPLFAVGKLCKVGWRVCKCEQGPAPPGFFCLDSNPPFQAWLLQVRLQARSLLTVWANSQSGPTSPEDPEEVTARFHSGLQMVSNLVPFRGYLVGSNI